MKDLDKILELVASGDISPKYAKKQVLDLFVVSKSFYQKHGDFPTAYIERNGKQLIQQRHTKEKLLAYLADKYPDWDIVESNFC